MNPLAADLDHILIHTEGLWEELRGGRLFMTGGTGWFGCWLLESFAWANDRLRLGCEAVVLTRDPVAFGRKCPHLAGRFLLLSSLKDAQGHFTHALHLAPVGVEETSWTLAHLLYRAGDPKVLLASSGAVYGAKSDHVSEEQEVAPVTQYALDKRVSEQQVRANRILCGDFRKADVKIARPFTFIGPYMPLTDKFAAGAFLRDALAGGPIRVKDGSVVRSYLYCADLAIWLWTILFRGEPCRPYNVGSEEAVSISELAGYIMGCFGCGIEVDLPMPMKGDRYVPSTKRARKELGLRQHISLPEAIDRTVRWYKERA